MTEEKLKIAQTHIDQYQARMAILEKDMAREARYIQEDIEKGKTYWIDAYAKKILGYQQQHDHYKKLSQEMQDLLDFLTGKNDEVEN
jgi:regulatory protein YycI of two-component signal transduction system YycFG